MAEPDAKLPTQVDFKAIFDSYVGTQAKTWSHDRMKSVGASEAFACIRQVFFKKRGPELGYEKDENRVESWGAMERGNVMEMSFVAPALLHAFGDNLLFAGSDQQTLVLGRSSSTSDGLVINQPRDALKNYGIDDIKSNCFGIEIKSVDPRVDIRTEKAIHRGQTQQQMGLMRDVTPYKPRYTVVLYVDASFYDVITPHIIEFDPKVWRTAKERAGNIWKSDNPMDFTPEGRFDDSCKLCAFKQACMGETLAAMPDEDKKRDKVSPTDLVDEAAPLVQEYEVAKKETKEAELRKELAAEAIKEFLREANRRKVAGDGWSASYYPVKGKESYDLEKMREAGIDLEPFKRTGDGHDQLMVRFST